MIDPAITAMLAIGSVLLAPEPAAVIAVPSDGLVRVRDLAWVSRGGELVVAQIKNATVLSPQRQAELVRNRLPGADFTLRFRQPVQIELRRPAVRPVSSGCSAAASLIPAGKMLESGDLVPVDCADKPIAAMLRPIGGGFQARTDISAGTPLGRPQVSPGARVASATAVVVRTKVGPVTIERHAETVQPGRAGRRVFVRTEDGAVLVAPLAVDEPENRP